MVDGGCHPDVLESGDSGDQGGAGTGENVEEVTGEDPTPQDLTGAIEV